MAHQINANPATKKISDLYSRIKSEPSTLILQPPFQRKFVWSKQHKEKFIETILKGLPFPEIYIAQSGVDLEKVETQEVVVDGQQRLHTIVDYIDELKNSMQFGKLVKKYKDLEKQDRRDFLNYNVIIRDLGDVEEGQIKEIFKRINLTQYGLNQVELHNAVYDGKFISVAKDVLEVFSSLELPFFTEKSVSRMADLDFILLIMSTIENGGYFGFDKETEKFIKEYNDDYEREALIKGEFEKLIKYIKNLNIPIDSIWFRKSNFFTLFVELFFNSDRLVKEGLLLEKLNIFEKKILLNKNKDKTQNHFAQYYSYMYVGTNSRQARVVRSEFFCKYVL